MFYDLRDNVKAKHFDELNSLSPYMRQAMFFKYLSEEIPLSVKDGDLIAGWYGYEDEDAPNPCDEKKFSYNKILTDKDENLKTHLRDDLKTIINFTKAHTCIDYETILQKGISHYQTLVDEELLKEPSNECLLAMKVSLDAVVSYAERFAEVLLKEIETCQISDKKEQLKTIHSALCRVPKFGAESFLEAVESLWITHSLIPMAEMSWASISVGRIDQYLYPYYKKHISDGGSKDEVKSILKNLFLLLDSYGDGACAMNIGGMDKDGNCLINELSLLLIEVEKEMRLRAPIFTVRVTPNMPDDILDSLIDFDLFKIGQPTFYGELSCREAMKKRGVTEDEAVNFSTNSCMGLIVPGKEFSDMWGIKFNAHLPLELAINGAKPLNSDIHIPLAQSAKNIDNIDSLLDAYGKYFRDIIAASLAIYEMTAEEAEANIPDPLLSALTEGCIANRRDRATGAVYNTVTVETMGLVNTCDAIFAIKELIFEQNKYTFKNLTSAARANYEGHEKLLADIRRCKKYGMGDEEYDSVFRKLCHKVSEVCKDISHGNRIYVPSLHTLTVNVGYGANLYATLDGRRAGDAVCKNANPSLLLENSIHTNVIRSASAFDQTEFSGGQPIDLYFDGRWFETKEMRDKIKALIVTYVKLGGLQLQVNSVDIELLEKAHASPKDYPFVIVRCGGYSVRFCDMGEKARQDFIELAKAQ